MQIDATTKSAPAEVLTCARCGQIVESLVNVVSDDGAAVGWCAECALQHAVACDRCGAIVDEDASICVHGWRWQGETRALCPDCAEHARVERCDRCGRYHMPECMTDVWVCGTTERWCDDCVSNEALQCDVCGEWYISTSSAIGTYDARDCDGDYTEMTLCDTCLEDDWVTCSECGYITRTENATYDEDEDEWRCARCSRSRYLHGYGHTSAREFLSLAQADRRRGLYLGVELETEDARECSPDELAKDVMTSSGGRWESALECKTDGSLSSSGVEVVSQPGTPEWHLEEGGVWDDVLEALVARGARSHDGGRCGLHVHVNRKYLACKADPYYEPGQRAAYVLDRLIQGHAPEWRRFSRRGSRLNYCSMGQVSEDGWSDSDFYSDCSTTCDKMDKLRRSKGGDRYQAVNDTNSSTVEIRLWRGTLNRATFRATLEASAALAIIARALAPYPDAVELISWADLKVEIRAALDGAGLPHDDLDAYLVSRGL